MWVVTLGGREVFGELHEGAHRGAGATLGCVAVGLTLVEGRTGDVEMVRTLLAGGANPNILDYTGRDAAGWALDSHRPNVIRLLKNTH